MKIEDMKLLRLALIPILACSFVSTKSGASEAKCVFTDLLANEKCPVFSTARALEFLSMGDDAVIFIESEKASADAKNPESKPDARFDAKRGVKSETPVLRERTSVVASSRVEDSVLMDEIDEDEGMLLEREVQELSGARYELPHSRREIKKQLGFPDTAEIASEDWIEMIRVHAETVLSISAVASRFLLEQVGLVATAPGLSPMAALKSAPKTGSESMPPDDAAISSSTVTASVLPKTDPETRPETRPETYADPRKAVGSNPIVVETH